MPRQFYTRRRGGQDAGHQPRHAAPLGQRRARSRPRATRATAGSCRPRRSTACAATPDSAHLSARNRFTGTVTRRQGRGPDRPGRDRGRRARPAGRDRDRRRGRGARPAEGNAGDGGRQGHVGDGPALMNGRIRMTARNARTRRRASQPSPSGAAARPTTRAASDHRLRGRVADGRVPEDRRRARSSRSRGSNTLADADPQGRAGRRVRLGEHDAPEAALHKDGFCSKPVVFTRNTLVVDRAEVEPGGHPQRLRPARSRASRS